MLAEFICHGISKWVKVTSYDDAPRVLAEQMAELPFVSVPFPSPIMRDGDTFVFSNDDGFIAKLIIDPETADCRVIAARRAAPGSVKERQVIREDELERCRQELDELHRNGVSRIDAIRIFKGRRSSTWVNTRWPEKVGQDTGGFIG